jgi:hypothetical protein
MGRTSCPCPSLKPPPLLTLAPSCSSPLAPPHRSNNMLHIDSTRASAHRVPCRARAPPRSSLSSSPTNASLPRRPSSMPDLACIILFPASSDLSDDCGHVRSAKVHTDHCASTSPSPALDERIRRARLLPALTRAVRF